jgi:cell fate (sporulation/competence/biofilm development) regulator YlbF (YheA/YmcA/DUF963 family)
MRLLVGGVATGQSTDWPGRWKALSRRGFVGSARAPAEAPAYDTADATKENSMSAVTELAGRLGQAIADSPEAKALNQARKELEADPQLRETMEQFGRQMGKVQKLEEENQPIEPEDKQKLAELEKTLAASEKFKAFSAAQVNFYDMMRKVNQAIREKISDLED